MDLDIGETRLLIETGRRFGLLRNQLAYVLATAYHETAHTMLPSVKPSQVQMSKRLRDWTPLGKKGGCLGLQSHIGVMAGLVGVLCS